MGYTPQYPLLNDIPLAPEAPARPSHAQRIQRAHGLAEQYAAGRELLDFYARLAFYQQHVLESLSKEKLERRETCGNWPLMLDSVLPLLGEFARSVAGIAPSALRERAATLSDSDVEVQSSFLNAFWESDGELDAADRTLALAFLQPYAEWLARAGYSKDAPTRHATCPICGSEAVCSVLRDRGHGAGRSLICSLCMHEWSFFRVACPACGEDRFDLLPVFTPDIVLAVRVDACDTCHSYVKTVDMTKDGFAVPVVDELAAISLDLWAAELQYVKLVPNLLGL